MGIKADRLSWIEVTVNVFAQIKGEVAARFSKNKLD